MSVYFLIFVVAVAAGFMAFNMIRMDKDITKLRREMSSLNDMMSDTREESASIHALRALYAELEDVKKDVASLQGDGLDKVLEKKWEDAIQRISDFDPFGDSDK